MPAALFSLARLSRSGPRQARENQRLKKDLLCSFQRKKHDLMRDRRTQMEG